MEAATDDLIGRKFAHRRTLGAVAPQLAAEVPRRCHPMHDQAHDQDDRDRLPLLPPFPSVLMVSGAH